jgi:DNA ligase-1
MEYKILVDCYKRLESTTSKLKKADILAELFRKVSTKDLPKIVLLIQGIVYPKYEQMELGVATQLMIRAISKATGYSASEIEKIFTKTGDLGLTAEECSKKRKQVVLFKKKLTVDTVFNNIAKLALITGEKSQERKLSLIAELLVSAEPEEAKYIVRTILEELRVGAAEGIIRDAVAKAFLITEKSTKKEKEEAIKAVEYAWNILSHFGEVAKIAKEDGIKGLKKVKPILGKPIQVMLGLAANSIEEVVKEFGKVAAEWKFDGMRTQLHKKGDKIWVFTRRLEDVTKQFPDIVKLARKGLKAKECIVEGEALGIDPKTGYPLPFQILSQRIHRKYEIEKMTKQIPIQVNLFDIVYLNGKTLFNKPLKERWEILKKNVKQIPNKFQLAKHIVTDNIKKLEEFYRDALNAKQEGIFLKVLNAPYIFGRHVGGWYKIKPVMETLDLAVVGAYWGEGARAKWLTSYLLACRDPDTGEFLECGKMSTGLTEKEYQEMTKLLKPLIISSKGKFVEVKPKIVLEVAYQEIQRSPNYPSGFALRFPRFVRFRPEKSPEEVDTLERVNKLFKAQRA